MTGSPVIRISIDIDNSKNDLLRIFYLDERLKKKNGNYYKRTQCYKKLNNIRLCPDYIALDNQISPTAEDLNDLAFRNNKNITLWSLSNIGQTPILLFESPKYENFADLNIAAPFFNEPNNFSLEELHLIVDINEYKRKVRKFKEGNIFQCLVWSGYTGSDYWEQLASIYGSDDVDLSDEIKFIKEFGVGFEIHLTKHRQNEKTEKMIIHSTRQDKQNKCLTLEFVGEVWDQEKSVVKITDQFILRPTGYFTSFPCPTINCPYVARTEWYLKRHQKSCTAMTITEYKQKNLTSNTVRDFCIKHGFIPLNYHQINFCTFDIECVGVPIETDSTNRTSILNVQRVISVSVSKSFGDRSTKVIVRKSMTEDDYHEFIKQFMNHLFEIREEFCRTIPTKIFESIKYIENEIQCFKQKERNYSFHQIKSLSSAKNYLLKLCHLRCYGYNSGRYDLPCLFPGLLTFADKNKRKISVLKRGNSFLSLTIDNVIFVDACNFTSGCSLDSFTRMWGASVTKAIFPYEKFSSIEALESTKDWPLMKDFHSKLNQQKHKYTIAQILEQTIKIEQAFSMDLPEIIQKIDPIGTCITVSDLANCEFPVKIEIYVDLWLFFEMKLRCGEMVSMKNYLEYYNSLDTISLVEAFENYIKSFILNFDVNPNDFITLPGLAERVMWSKFDSSKFAPYTFGKDFGHVNKLIRENLKGGLSCVFARHVEVGCSTNQYSRNVHNATNGESFERIIAMDANSKAIYYLTSIYKNRFLTHLS